MRAKKPIIIVVKLYRIFYINIDMTQRHSWAGQIWKDQIIYIGGYERDFAQWEKMSWSKQ